MDGTILNKKYNLVERIEALENGGSGPTLVPGEAIAFYPEEEGEYSINVKTEPQGGLALNENGQLYVNKPSMIDQNNWDFNNGNSTEIGKVIIGQNVYPLKRACFNPPYQMWIQANQDVANFLNPSQVPFPIDSRCIKFYIFDTNNRNITEMAVIERSTGGFMRILKSFNTDTIQIGKFVVEYYEIPATTSKKKSSK